MGKNKILAKLNLKIKDYNNELEKILEDKLFSFDVKNLLLNMLYKIENAYEDYETAKVEVLSKDDFIENIFRIIREKCLKIFLVKPETAEAEELEKENKKYKIDRKNGEIYCFQNELTLLTALFEIDETDYELENLPYEYMEKPLKYFIYLGKLDSQREIIRDFNGWSWDTDIKRIKNIENNYTYLLLLLANGEKKLLNFDQDLTNLIAKFAVKQYISEKIDLEFNSKIKQLTKEKENRLELFAKKGEFISKVTEEKKEYTKKIEKIDKILNDKELLKKEYYARNEKLPNKEKIFSISFLVRIIERERSEYLEKIEENNRIILPKEYIEEKTRVEKEVKFLKSLTEDDEEIIEIGKRFLKVLKQKVEKITEENKEEIVKIIYKIRYFKYIPVSYKKIVKDIVELKRLLEQIEKIVIKKAIALKILEDISEDEDFTYQVLKEIFNTKIIKLENINIQCEIDEQNIVIGYYDDTIIENKIKIKKKNIKFKKKSKLFV